MKALILAAGLGSRLRPLTNDKPKCLVEVNNVPIIFKQIENIIMAGIPSKDIFVVTGYLADVLKMKVLSKYNDINFIDNINYQNNNNMFSVYLSKGILHNEDFIMMNADVFFDSNILKELLMFKRSNAIVVDYGNYLDESMKVIMKEDKLIEISKEIKPSDALGNSIDVYKFSSDAGIKLFNRCCYYIENRKELKLWSEVAINDILKECDFYPFKLNGRWYEIDNHDDLKHAEELFID